MAVILSGSSSDVCPMKKIGMKENKGIMLLWLEAGVPEVQTVSLMVQAQSDGAGTWVRTSGSPVRAFGCCEKGSQRFCHRNQCQGNFACPVHFPVCWGGESWESWVNRTLSTSHSPSVCAATCKISPRNPEGSSPEQERRKGKQDWQKIELSLSPPVKSFGSTNRNFTPHLRTPSIFPVGAFQAAGGSRVQEPSLQLFRGIWRTLSYNYPHKPIKLHLKAGQGSAPSFPIRSLFQSLAPLLARNNAIA